MDNISPGLAHLVLSTGVGQLNEWREVATGPINLRNLRSIAAILFGGIFLPPTPLAC